MTLSGMYPPHIYPRRTLYIYSFPNSEEDIREKVCRTRPEKAKVLRGGSPQAGVSVLHMRRIPERREGRH